MVRCALLLGLLRGGLLGGLLLRRGLLSRGLGLVEKPVGLDALVAPELLFDAKHAGVFFFPFFAELTVDTGFALLIRYFVVVDILDTTFNEGTGRTLFTSGLKGPHLIGPGTHLLTRIFVKEIGFPIFFDAFESVR